jgi:hypothetical protein
LSELYPRAARPIKLPIPMPRNVSPTELNKSAV